MEKKIFILDAYALIFRAYYAFINNPRYNSKGLNTSAIFGFTNTLDEIIKKEKPTHICVCFDAPVPSFRKEMFPEYKAQRPATPEDIKLSVPYIKQIIEAYRIPIYEIGGYEADDLAGAIAKIFSKRDFKVFLMTSDKDYLQLIDENICVYKPKTKTNEVQIIGIPEFQEMFGLDEPKQFIHVLALAGDAADNIPGLAGVGEKTALKLLQEYKSIENIYANINNLKGKLKEKFELGKSTVDLSVKLVTIKIDIELNITDEDVLLKDLDENKITELFKELEFRTTLDRIIKKPQPVQQSLFGFTEEIKEEKASNFLTIKDIKPNYQLIETEYEIEQLASKLNNSKEFAFDTETTSVDAHSANIVGISFCLKKNEAYYIPISNKKDEAIKTLSYFKSALENSNILKIGQNIKYDYIILSHYNISVSLPYFDTMIAQNLVSPELRNNMDYMAEIYLNYKTIHIEEIIGKGTLQRNMADLKPSAIKDYAAEDADITFQLKQTLFPKLETEKVLDLFNNIEMPLVKVLSEIETNGVLLDIDFLNIYRNEIYNKIITLEKDIYQLAGQEFNISSPKQLGDILFLKLKIIDNPKLTKTKQFSTGETDLLYLKDKHEIINYILNYRSLKKLLGTYIDALPKLINSKTNRIHTSYNQAVTVTGRLSSNNPNLQNIPIRTAEGREIRKAFIASENSIIIDADYSQVELRLMAHLSQDDNMLSAFKNDIDIHTQTAANIFGVKIEEVTKEMRYQAKTANFAMIYGSSSFGLSQNLNISRTDAKTLMDNYFKTYPKVKEYMDKMIAQAREKEFVTTLMGRKRYLPDINSNNGNVQKNAENNAINTPIQGSAADIIKLAMLNIDKKFKTENLKSKMIMQVHDELVFDVPIEEKDLVKQIIKQEMENAVNLSVPLLIEINEGKNWFDAH